MMFEKQVDVMNQMVDSFISDNNARNEEFNNQVKKIPLSNIHMYRIMGEGIYLRKYTSQIFT